MNIAALIGVMIAIVIGVCLISSISETAGQITTENGYSSAISDLAGVLVIVFVTVIILGAVAFIGMGATESGRKEKEKIKVKVSNILKNTKELIFRIEKSSENYNEYINNLNEILGVKTVNTSSNSLQLNEYEEPQADINGKLFKWHLDINSRDYDWYITEKSKDLNIFKIVGLNKKDSSKNRVFVLGNLNNKPFLKELSLMYVESKYQFVENKGE